MKCEILASVMNQKDKETIIDRLNVNSDAMCLVVNQITKDITLPKDEISGNHRFISYKERGLSKSRNNAVRNAIGDVCILADDDVEFVSNYEAIIKDAYNKYPDADIIAFHYEYLDISKKKKKKHEGRVGRLKGLGISSMQITFKLSSINKNNIKFNESFGAGSGKCDWGEDNIFIQECLKKGLRIYYVPKTILKIHDYGTTWDRSNTFEHFKKQGWLYYELMPKAWRILALQFVLRKRKIYGMDMSGYSVYRAIVSGAKAYKKERKNG